MCSRTLRTTPPVRQNEVGDCSFDHLVGHLTQIIDGHDFDGQSEVNCRLGLGTKGVRGIRASLAEPEVVLLILRTKDQAMEIESTTFGTITIDGKTHEHDVVIRLSGEIVKRKKKLSKKYYGTSHVVSKDEAKFVFERGCEQLIVGSGQMGNVHLSPEAEAYFAKKNCKVILQPTPKAIHVFNRSTAKKIGIFHVTC
jgi:hypothetical protein